MKPNRLTLRIPSFPFDLCLIAMAFTTLLLHGSTSIAVSSTNPMMG
jgi:hypothetical protein